ncbi:MAG: glycosyltransferase family 4 protein [Dehalococcoidia bacterium]
MRIALVSPYDFAIPGGVNNHIRYLAQQFAHLGHDVRIVAPSSQPPPGDIANLVVMGRRPVGVPAGGSIAHVALSPGLARAVRRLLEGEGFAVVHLHEPFMPFVPLQFLRFSQAVNIGTFHAVKDKGNRLYSVFRPLVGRYVRYLDGRTAVSPVARNLIHRYLPGDYEVIPNGIEFHHFARPAPPLPGLADGRPTILFVGRQEKRKGLTYLLWAFARVKAQLPEARLLIVGPDGGIRQGCQRLIDKLRLRDVIFADFVPYQDLPRYYQAADVFCAPNLGNESFGIVLLEAMAAGTPVVASAIEAFTALVEDGVEGLLVPPRDAEALAAALLRLLADRQRRQAMGHCGQLKAQGYDWGRIAHQTIAYYQRVAQERGKGHLLSASVKAN